MPDSGTVDALRAIVAIQQAALTDALTVDAVMRRIAEQASAITQATGAVMEVVDGNELRYAHGAGSLAGTEGLRLPISESLSGLAVRTGAVQLSNDALSDPRVDHDATAKIGARAMLIVPLAVDGEVLAVLKIVSDRIGAFSARDVEILSTLATFVATVVKQTRAMQDRRLEHETYRLISQASSDAILQVGLDGRIRWASPAVEEILGYPPALLEGRDAADLIRPDLREQYLHHRKEAVDTGADSRWEYPALRADDTEIWVESAGRLARDERGRPLYRVVRLRDITAGHVAVESLARSEEQFRLALQNAPIGMCLIGADGSFLQVNQALCELLGRSEAVLMKCSWQELTHPEDLNVDLDYNQQVLDGEIDRYRLVKRYLHPDGSVVWGELAVSCVRDDAGAVVHFVSQIVDVTETMQEQQEAAATIGRYQRLVGVGSDIIAELDEHDVVSWVSPNTRELLGAPPAEVVGRAVTDFVPDDQRARVRAGLSDSASSHLELSVRRLDGEIIRAEAVIEPIAGAGHIIRIRDITEHYLTREDLRGQLPGDPATGLLSQPELERRLEALLDHMPRQGNRTLLASVRIDGGDEPELIQVVAQRARQALRDSDFVARVGQAELLVVLPGITYHSAGLEVLARVLAEAGRPHMIRDAILRPRLSIGVTEVRSGEWLEDVLSRAEQAAAVAQQRGGNRVQMSGTEEPLADVLQLRPQS